MAAGILFVVAEKLAALRRPEFSTYSIDYSGIEQTETELRRVHDILEEDPGLEMNSKALRKWVRDLTDATQDVEDIVDNFVFSHERRQQPMGYINSAFFTLRDLVPCCKGDAEIEQMKEKLRKLCLNYPSMPNKQVFGFDKDVDELLKLLVEGNEHPLYMFIVGSCGAGKTTLVKEVYNNAAVMKKFPDRVWLGGEKYNLAFWKKMTIKVTKCSQHEVEIIRENIMCKKISEALKGKRYLIVLDSINLRYYGYNFIVQFISNIRQAFPNEKNGSRVVITCNDGKDAKLFGENIVVHELKMLSLEDRLNLFTNTCDFESAEAETTAGTSLSSGRQRLEEIVREQKHLPSEIVNLGARLSMEYGKRSSLSNIMIDYPHYNQVDGPLRTKMASNFNLLDSHLKLCFLYCSLFPRGFEILKRRLIWLWVEEEMFEWDLERRIGHYLEEQLDLGMIQVEYSYWREGLEHIALLEHFYCAVQKIRLDSPVWEFAAMKAIQCNLLPHINDEGSSDNTSNARALTLNSKGIYDRIFHDQNGQQDFQNLRFLLYLPQPTNVTEDKLTFPAKKFKLLRVLDLEDMYCITQLSEEIGELLDLRRLGLWNTGLSSLPKSIGNLKYLRSLDLRNTCIHSLPDSIGNLKYLQSLDIRGTGVKPIPTAIQKLKRLQYLYMDVDDGSTDKDSLDLSSLKSLRVLSVIRVGPWMKNGLRKLIHLRKLGIYGDPLDYAFAQELNQLEHLQSLRLGFGFGDLNPQCILHSSLDISSLYLESPLEKLPDLDKFSSFLKKLCLKWTLLEQDPMATLKELKSLTVLKFGCGSFLGKKMVCSNQWFPELLFLELSLLDGLEEWTVENGAMPRLKHLVIRLCNRLKELPQGLELFQLSSTNKLEVVGMPDAFNASLRRDKIEHKKSVSVDGSPMAVSSSSSPFINHTNKYLKEWKSS